MPNYHEIWREVKYKLGGEGGRKRYETAAYRARPSMVPRSGRVDQERPRLYHGLWRIARRSRRTVSSSGATVHMTCPYTIMLTVLDTYMEVKDQEIRSMAM